MLGSLDLIDQDALSRYLLSETQHQIGGFGKLPGDPPGRSLSSSIPYAKTNRTRYHALLFRSCWLGMYGTSRPQTVRSLTVHINGSSRQARGSQSSISRMFIVRRDEFHT